MTPSARRLWSCSSTAPTPPVPGSSPAPGCSPTLGSCAAGWMGSRSPSSSPRPAPGRSRPGSCSRSSISASNCCVAAGPQALDTTAWRRRSKCRRRCCRHQEQCFFRRLGVFIGPFDLGLAHAVAGEPGEGRLRTLDTLAALVDRSLVTTDVEGQGTRYRLLELLREHTLAELHRADELDIVEERFIEAMAVVADQFVAEAMERWGTELLTEATAQFTNLVQAVELCLERDLGPEPCVQDSASDVCRRARRPPLGSLGARLPCARALAWRTSASAGRGARCAGHRRRARRSAR